MKALRVFLAVAGLVCLSGFLGVVVPPEVMARTATRYGVEAPAAGPLFTYVFRLAAAVVASCGVFYLVLASDPKRHGLLVPVGGAALLFVGAVLGVTGSSAGMVPGVFLLDALSCAGVGLGILVTWAVWGRRA